MPTKIEKDAVTGRETTGHEWDGIKELNNPLPKWWLYSFYVTIALSLAGFVALPSIPLGKSYFAGLLGYDQRTDVARAMAEAAERQAPFLTRIAAASLDDIRKNPELFGYAQLGGRIAFNNNCAQCHQTGGAGASGFPNLADDEWLWGGDLEQIHYSIAYGIRNANEKSRQSAMPRFGVDKILEPRQIDDVTEYVLSLGGRASDQAAAGRGAATYAENCVACHGEKGEGNVELGSPNLADAIWLYGGDRAAVRQTIFYARNGNMPAWSERLDATTVKMLAVYVHGLGGGR